MTTHRIIRGAIALSGALAIAACGGNQATETPGAAVDDGIQSVVEVAELVPEVTDPLIEELRTSAIPLAIGGSDAERVAGSLADGDPTYDTGEYMDRYSFVGRAGQVLILDADSDEFDTWLVIRGPGGYMEFNDDRGHDNVNARLRVRLPQTAAYIVEVTSYAPGETGSYVLSSAEMALPAPTPAMALELGADVAGSLDEGDATHISGGAMDRWAVALDGGQSVVVVASSDAFDTVVEIDGPGGFATANDDAPGQGTNSRASFVAPESGTYYLTVRPYDSTTGGTYALSAYREDVALQAEPTATSGATAIAYGESLTGELDGGDATRATGQSVESFTFTGHAGERVVIDLSSADFDTYLFLQGPDGRGTENDDVAVDNFNSRIDYVLPTSGAWNIIASSYEIEEAGAFNLSLQRGGLITALTEEPTGVPAETGADLRVGDVIAGTLDGSEPSFTSGEFYDVYTVQAPAGTALTIDLESDDFDTYVLVESDIGYSDANDDAEPGNYNSRIGVAADGTLMKVFVTSYGAGQTGSYRISISDGVPATGALATSITNGRPGGQIYAVIAGITEYVDQSSLAYCADDATKLHGSLAETGILAPESVVLTDAEVTRDALQSAIADVAAQVGPDDTFLFFYSGHGGQRDTGDEGEPDGRDESMYVRDGHINDDELALWLEPVDARLEIIAMDACFSGGFARDLVTEPNRVGIFSSEEDVISLVAENFEAGGYLSHFIRTGLAGDADVFPTDGTITVGELTQHIRTQWAQHMTGRVSTTGDDELTYQNLVIDRIAKVSEAIVYPAN